MAGGMITVRPRRHFNGKLKFFNKVEFCAEQRRAVGLGVSHGGGDMTVRRLLEPAIKREVNLNVAYMYM